MGEYAWTTNGESSSRRHAKQNRQTETLSICLPLCSRNAPGMVVAVSRDEVFVDISTITTIACTQVFWVGWRVLDGVLNGSGPELAMRWAVHGPLSPGVVCMVQ